MRTASAPPRALALLVLVLLPSAALPRAGADDTGVAITRTEVGYCGTWHSSLGPNPCRAESEATLVVTGCAGDHCDLVLTQRGTGHAAMPGLMEFGLMYLRGDYADDDGMQLQPCRDAQPLPAPLEALVPPASGCLEVCRVGPILATSVGCSAEVRDRAHIPPGDCSVVFDGALLRYDEVQNAQATPGFQICRDAAGAVSVSFA